MFGRSKKAQEWTVSNRTLLRIIGFGIATVLLVRIFQNMVHPLTLIFVSSFLAMALNPAVLWVSKRLKNRNRTKATAIAYVAVMSALIGFFALVLPPLINQTSDFISEVPQTLRDLENSEGVVGDFIRNNELEEQITQFANDWATDFASVGNQAVSLANRIVSNIVSIVTVLVLTFMMLVEGPRWIKAFWKQYPASRRSHAQSLAAKIYGVVTSYVNGQVLVAAIGAGFSVVALLISTTIFDVSTVNAIALGGIVFLFSLIPTVGVILSSAIVVLFSLFASVPLAITMLVYFIVYQQIENVTIQPYIQSKGLELTPLTVFLAAILGIGFGGVIGAFVAIPIAGCIKVLAEDYLERRQKSKETSS